MNLVLPTRSLSRWIDEISQSTQNQASQILSKEGFSPSHLELLHLFCNPLHHSQSTIEEQGIMHLYHPNLYTCLCLFSYAIITRAQNLHTGQTHEGGVPSLPARGVSYSDIDKICQYHFFAYLNIQYSIVRNKCRTIP